MRPMLNYYGGKWNAAAWIIENFPKHTVYVEPFFGGGSVLLQKPRSKREIVNDLDDEITNLFKCARDHGPALKAILKYTPYARTEYENCAELCKIPIEQARRTIVKSYMGIGDSITNTNNGFRQSKDANTCNAKSWTNYVDAFDELIERLQGVMIENRDYKKVMDYYDAPDTLFYLDPPYVRSTRNIKHTYTIDWTDEAHIELVEFLQDIKGMVVLSGYDSPIYESLSWRKVHKDFTTNAKGSRTETLWINHAADKEMAQLRFE